MQRNNFILIDGTSYTLKSVPNNKNDDRPLPYRTVSSTFKNEVDANPVSTTKPLKRISSGEVSSTKQRLKSSMSVTSLQQSLQSCLEDSIDNTCNESTRMRNISPSMPVLPSNHHEPMKRNVSFNRVEIREYERSIGDNPSCQNGPPIGIGWRYLEEMKLDIEEYEEKRKCFRLPSTELRKIPSSDRQMMLKDIGYSYSEIRKALKKKNVAKNRRRTTVDRIKFSQLEEAMESISRKLKRLSKGTGDERQMEQCLDNTKTVRMKRIRSHSSLF